MKLYEGCLKKDPDHYLPWITDKLILEDFDSSIRSVVSQNLIGTDVRARGQNWKKYACYEYERLGYLGQMVIFRNDEIIKDGSLSPAVITRNRATFINPSPGPCYWMVVKLDPYDRTLFDQLKEGFYGLDQVIPIRDNMQLKAALNYLGWHDVEDALTNSIYDHSERRYLNNGNN